MVVCLKIYVYPIFQVWHPIEYSSVYMKLGEVQLSSGSLKGVGERNCYYTNVTLNSSSQIKFHSGSVIGYYQPPNSQQIWSIQTSGYTPYSNTVTSPLPTMDITNVDNVNDNYQPLIEVMFGKVITVCMPVIMLQVTFLCSHCFIFVTLYGTIANCIIFLE